jgi:2-polyprenyl-3-methyl-5-hydroxy-6-metoxy-1,4-benzoquinol methylase
MMNYTLNFSPFDAHSQILKLVGSNQRVLELGCASGYLSEMMTRQGCEVVGVERESKAALMAERFCRQVIVGDLNVLGIIPYSQESFDVLLLADILEHLVDPLAVLQRFVGYVKGNGRIILSIPNVANWAIRWELLNGKWNYTDGGSMDRTHLRFYTRRTIRELLNMAGLTIVQEDVTQGLYQLALYRATVHRILVHLGLHNRLAYRLSKTWPELWAFQFLIVARRKASSPGD